MGQLILAIDTALSACSVALTRDNETLVSAIEPMQRGQAERLAPMVSDLMLSAGLAFSQIDIIAVTTGPGAFTGLRVGLAFARGLALALNRPCVGFSTLDVLAAGADRPQTVAAIGVAGHIFMGAWQGRTQVIAPCRGELAALIATLDGDWTVTGPAAADILALRTDWLHVDQSLPDPVILALLARDVDPVDYPPTPLYLRGVDAKLPGGLSLTDANS
jgi:tRNA threonylcarbamoyladenosine biosynthesis protein TsaB